METENVENSVPTPVDVHPPTGDDAEVLRKQVEDLIAEKESLSKQLSDTRSEAAKYRIGKREATEQTQTLEQRIAQLEEENKANRLEVERAKFLQAENLPVELGELLGNDPESFQHRVGLLKSHVKPSAPVDQGKPVGVEVLSGGLTPQEHEAPFDPAELIRNRRKR